MKKHYYLLVIAALALASFVPAAVRAESGSSNDSSDDNEVEIEIENKSDDDNVKPSLIREKLRIKTENGEIREDIRNRLLNNGLSATSTRYEVRIASTAREERKEIRVERREDVGEIREEMRERIKSASSSEDRREIRMDMRKDTFDIRKQALVKQLEVSLNNLKQIRERIASRIDKAEENGKDMSKAQGLLITADAKIATAETAVDVLAAFTPSSTATSTEVTATSTVDLTKPRQIGETAIKAIKDAHRSLVEVVVAIAQSLGNGRNATSTPPVVPPVTSTSTDTTTGTTTDTTTGTSTDTTTI